MSTDVHIFQNTSATTRSAIRSRDPKRSTRQTKRSRKLDSATRHTCACAGECHGVTLDSSPLATRLNGLLTVSPPTCMCSPPADPLRVSRQSVISTLEDVVTTCHRSWAALRLRERGVRSNMVRFARRAHAAAWVLLSRVLRFLWALRCSFAVVARPRERKQNRHPTCTRPPHSNTAPDGARRSRNTGDDCRLAKTHSKECASRRAEYINKSHNDGPSPSFTVCFSLQYTVSHAHGSAASTLWNHVIKLCDSHNTVTLLLSYCSAHLTAMTALFLLCHMASNAAMPPGSARLLSALPQAASAARA